MLFMDWRPDRIIDTSVIEPVTLHEDSPVGMAQGMVARFAQMTGAQVAAVNGVTGTMVDNSMLPGASTGALGDFAAEAGPRAVAMNRNANVAVPPGNPRVPGSPGFPGGTPIVAAMDVAIRMSSLSYAQQRDFVRSVLNQIHQVAQECLWPGRCC